MKQLALSSLALNWISIVCTLATVSLFEVGKANIAEPFVCPEDGLFPVSLEACTSSYYACSRGNTEIRSCSGDGSALFDPASSSCVINYLASCYPLALTCPEPNEFYSIPDTCSSVYYMCIDSVVYERICPANGIFDPDRRICALPETVPCYAGSTGPSFECPPEDGKYPDPDPESCDAFYVCVTEVAFPSTCPYGWCFDPNTRECSSTYVPPLTRV